MIFHVCLLEGKNPEKVTKVLSFDNLDEAYKMRDSLIAKMKPVNLLKERYGIRFWGFYAR